MPSAELVIGRNSRHALRSFSDGPQPLAMLSSFPACSPSRAASAGKLGCFAVRPESSSAASSASVKPAFSAAAAAETPVMARALRKMSPRWSSKSIRPTLIGQESTFNLQPLCCSPPRQALQPERRLRFRLTDGSQFRQRVRPAEGSGALDAGSHRPGQSDAGNSQFAAALHDLTDPFAHERRVVNRPFTRDDQVSRTQTMLQRRVSGEHIEPWFQSRSEEGQQTESQPARRPGSRLAGEVAPQLFFDPLPPAVQGTFRQLEILAAQPFLRPINPRRPARAKQWILHVHRHHPNPPSLLARPPMPTMPPRAPILSAAPSTAPSPNVSSANGWNRSSAG